MRVIKLEISRFPHKELPYMPGSQTTQGRLDTRAGVSDRVAFRVSYLVGALRFITFAAQWLAYTLPCRRFTDILAEACARLGGQCGSLLLHCDGLAPSTPCRSPGAQLADLIGRGDRIRTCDIYVPNVALYQSELHPGVNSHAKLPGFAGGAASPKCKESEAR